MKSKRRTLTMMLLTVVLNVLMSVSAFAVSGFTDVPPDSPWYDGVTYFEYESHGIMIPSKWNNYRQPTL